MLVAQILSLLYNIVDRIYIARIPSVGTTALGVVGIYSFITAVLICLGYNKLYFELKLPNGSVGQLLDVMDYISNSFLMPFISLLTSILIGWVIGPDWIIGEVERNGEKFKRAGMYRFMIRYVVPVVMLVLFLVSTGFADLIA